MDPSETQTPLLGPGPRPQTPPAPFSPAAIGPHPQGLLARTPSQCAPEPVSMHRVPSQCAPEPVGMHRVPSQCAPEPVGMHRVPSQCAPEPVGMHRVHSHGSSKYLHAVPLHTLTRRPAPVDCPACNRRGATVCSAESGSFTHLWAALACATCCMGCVPYLVGGLKDVRHSCAECGALLAVWHRSGGGTEVLAHALK